MAAKLEAPQYPKGLYVTAYVNKMDGDVGEIDGLNHYIGMRPLGEAAEFERSISIIGIAVVSLLILAAVFVHNRWAALLTLPALFLPLIFLGDLQFWLANFGTNLDPTAALSSSIDPFIPPVLGRAASPNSARSPAFAMAFGSQPRRLQRFRWACTSTAVPISRWWTHTNRQAGHLACNLDNALWNLSPARHSLRCIGPLLAIVLFVVCAGIPAAAQETVLDLQAAVAAAQPGAMIEVPPGTYPGPLRIDKPVTLEGQGLPVIQGTGEGDVIEIDAPDVTLRGFVVRGSGISLDDENSGITVGAPNATTRKQSH